MMNEAVVSDAPTNSNIQAFYPFMVIAGVVQILVPACINLIMQQMGVREHLGGLIHVVYFVGLLSGTLLLTLFMQRLSVKQIMLFQAVLLSASLLATAAAPWFALLLFFFCFTGFANGMILTLPAVYITHVYGDKGSSIQNILYGFMSLGFVLGPLFAGLVARQGWSWRWCYIVPALAALPLAIPIAVVKLKRLPKPKKLSFKVLGDVLAFNRSLFTGLVLAFFLYAAAQASVNTWLVTFLEVEKGMVSGSAHVVLVGVAVSLTLGRWTCGYLSKKIEPFDILVTITIASGVLVFLAPLPEAKIASIALYTLLGFTYAGINPFLLSYAAWFPESESSAVVSAIFSAGGLGGIFFPYLIGLLNQHINPILGMSSVAVFILGVIICVHWIKPHVVSR